MTLQYLTLGADAGKVITTGKLNIYIRNNACSANTGLQAGSPGYGGNDYWVLKTDNSGSIQWQKRYGGAADDFLYSISETPDGYLFGGFSVEGSFNTGNQAGTNKQGGFDFWVVRTDKNGHVGMVR